MFRLLTVSWSLARFRFLANGERVNAVARPKNTKTVFKKRLFDKYFIGMVHLLYMAHGFPILPSRTSNIPCSLNLMHNYLREYEFNLHFFKLQFRSEERRVGKECRSR